ncbi:hypothetical protein FRB95_001591 [Tulasnella sp. JGI-2019a]|nr:hypothetical protein FRB95_001591 [Tulasnella sp. JGI-2019a]
MLPLRLLKNRRLPTSNVESNSNVAATSPQRRHRFLIHHTPPVPFDASAQLIHSSTSALVTDGADVAVPEMIPNTICPILQANKFLHKELGVQNLNDIIGYLWMAGLPLAKTRAFHRQMVMSRNIVVCEQIGLHLVWKDNVIFIKPIPHFLLDHRFFNDHITPDPHLKTLALGFLATYLVLIRHKSNFNIALEYKLIPESTTWFSWLRFAAQITASLQVPGEPEVQMKFENRYRFGELRLSRLNRIMQFFFGHFSRGYQRLDPDYTYYFSPFAAFVALLFVYVSTALSAFQVAQGGTQATTTVLSIAYWFAIVTLITLVVTILLPMLWFLILFVDSAMYAASTSLE